jgi:hypothetical protein
VRHDFVFLAIESVSVAIRTCRHMPCNDGLTPLANLEAPRCIDNFFRPRGTLGKMAIRHVSPIPDRSLELKYVSAKAFFTTNP